jgi:hypothetical protein
MAARLVRQRAKGYGSAQHKNSIHAAAAAAVVDVRNNKFI